MRNKALFIGLAALMSGISGCAVAVAPVEVTRFHAGTPAAKGSIAIEEAPDSAALGGGSGGMEFRSYTAAVGQELQRIGFTEITDGKTDGQTLALQKQMYQA